MWRSLLLALSILLSLVALGCTSVNEQQPEEQKGAVLFDPEEDVYDQMLLVIKDPSRSFKDKLGPDGEASKFVLTAIEKYQRSTAGSDKDGLIVAQLADNEHNLILYQGVMRNFRKHFLSFNQFSEEWGKITADRGSRIHDGLSDLIGWMLRDRRMKKTKFVVLVVTDGENNLISEPTHSERLDATLKALGKRQGSLGMYHLKLGLKDVWEDRLQRSGIKDYVVHTGQDKDLKYPRFD